MNEKIKAYAKASGVPLWKLAKQYGVAEMTLSRWLREELPKDREERMLKTIDEVSTAQKEGVK